MWCERLAVNLHHTCDDDWSYSGYKSSARTRVMSTILVSCKEWNPHEQPRINGKSVADLSQRRSYRIQTLNREFNCMGTGKQSRWAGNAVRAWVDFAAKGKSVGVSLQ